MIEYYVFDNYGNQYDLKNGNLIQINRASQTQREKEKTLIQIFKSLELFPVKDRLWNWFNPGNQYLDDIITLEVLPALSRAFALLYAELNHHQLTPLKDERMLHLIEARAKDTSDLITKFIQLQIELYCSGMNHRSIEKYL